MNTETVPTTIGGYTLSGLAEIAGAPKETAALLRTMLRKRTGFRFSVTVGRGTAANHIYIATGDLETADAQRSAFESIFDRRPMGHPMMILLDSSERLRYLIVVAGADPAAEWLDIVAPRRNYGY